MKLISLYIENYKKFNRQNINFDESILEQEFEKFYGKAKITTLIGSNGSGKTTILSFIAKIFRFIQIRQENIESEYCLIYEIGGNLIKIEYLKNSVYFTLNNNEKKLLLEMRRKKGKSEYFYKEHQKEEECEAITFDVIKEYIPKNLIVSAFDSDYFGLDYGSFTCEHIVKLNNTHYFKSFFSLEISLGIIRFFDEYSNNNNFKTTLQNMNISFNGNIKAYLKFSVNEDTEIYEELESFSNKYNIIFNRLIENIENGYIFKKFIIEESINDFQWKFNMIKFINYRKYNLELLEILIRHRCFFINDIYLGKTPEYSIENMSTGEKLILGRIFFILSHIKDNSLLIIEEPEIHLNYLWARHVFSILLTLVKKYEIHMLISSHNWTFINNLNPSQILLMESKHSKKICHPKESTFLADINVINDMFNNEVSSDNSIEEYIYKLMADKDLERLKFYFSIMGESYLKVLVFKKLMELGGLDINVESDK